MISGCEKVIFAILLIMFFISSSSAAMFHPPEYEIHYDQNGNIIQEPGYHYEYNNFNKLTTIKNGTENGPTIYTFTYDENGQKIKQTQHQQNGQTKTTTYIDENYQTTTQENNTTTQTTIYANGKIIAKKTNNNTTYYLTDIRGSTTKTLNQQGQETTQNTYLPYGKTTNNPTTQHTYTGQEQTTNNLLYYNARNYNTLTKQFTQPDTITTNPHNPQNLNKYTYTNNNPIKYTDPSGHIVWAPFIVMGLSYLVSNFAPEIVLAATSLSAADLIDSAQNFREKPSLATGFFLTLSAIDALEPVFPEGQIAKKTIKCADNVKDSVVRWVDPKVLKPTHGPNRPNSGELVADIAESMRKNGYDESKPLKVVTLKDGSMGITDGHHRRMGAIEAGLGKVPVIEDKAPYNLFRTTAAGDQIALREPWEVELGTRDYEQHGFFGLFWWE